MPKAKAVVETCVSKTVLFFQSFEHKAQEFKPSYHIKQIIENCSLTKYQKDLPNITFKNSFQISLTACLLAYAMPIFDKMQERFENKEDIKELYWTLFKSVVKREECEQIQATLFVKILENLSTEKIENSLDENNIKDKTWLLNKTQEQILAEGWDGLRSYIEYPILCCEKVFASEYVKQAEADWGKIRTGIETAIRTAAEQVQPQSVDIRYLLDMFIIKENNIDIPPSSFWILFGKANKTELRKTYSESA